MATDLNDFEIINIIVDQPLYYKRPGPMIGHFSMWCLLPHTYSSWFSQACGFQRVRCRTTLEKRGKKKKVSGKNLKTWYKMSLTQEDSCILHPQNIALFSTNFPRLSYTSIILIIIHFNHSLTNIKYIHYYNHHYYCRLLILLSPTFHHCSQ